MDVSKPFCAPQKGGVLHALEAGGWAWRSGLHCRHPSPWSQKYLHSLVSLPSPLGLASIGFIILDYDVYNVNKECTFLVYMCGSEEKSRRNDPNATSTSQSLCVPSAPKQPLCLSCLFGDNSDFLTLFLLSIMPVKMKSSLSGLAPNPPDPRNLQKSPHESWLQEHSGLFWQLN